MNMKLPQSVVTALRLLENDGYSAYVVGGAVRDHLRGEMPSDFDLTTSALPEETLDVFADFRTIPTGLKHGTVTVIINSTPLEITTYRIDGEYADSRHPTAVTFTDRIEDDLSRRDFTVNAMAYSPTRGLVDCYGGRADLSRGVIRAVGEPHRRFDEDALRILRALRFASKLDFTIEDETASAARELASHLSAVSAERIQAELYKLVTGAGAGRIIREYADILSVVIPELAHLTVDELTAMGTSLDKLYAKAYLRLSCMFSYFGNSSEERHRAAERIMRGLKSDNRTRERILTIVGHLDDEITSDAASVRRSYCCVGEENFYDILKIRASRGENTEEIENVAREVLREFKVRGVRDLAVSGGDLMAIGVAEGKGVGDALTKLLGAVLDGRVENERSALLAYFETVR